MIYDHIYTWGNNEKRQALKGKKCAIIARGKKGSIMVEFEDGSREITSHYAVKKGEISMERRSYRSNVPEPSINRENVPTPELPEEQPKSTSRDSKFRSLTGLFRSKSGKADTVFVTEDIVKRLSEIAPGDVLGVSENSKNGNLQMWYIPKEDE